ncbi:hypothetical protein Tco_1430359 [Tanacetum coccineum]
MNLPLKIIHDSEILSNQPTLWSLKRHYGPQQSTSKTVTNIIIKLQSKPLKLSSTDVWTRQLVRHSNGSLPSNTQPNPRGNNSKAYQPPQSHNEHVNVVFTRSGKSYDPPVNPNDQQNNSETTINFDSDDEDDEPTP